MYENYHYDLTDFEYEVLQLYLKHGFGEVFLYNTTFFTTNLCPETCCLTLKEFAARVNQHRLNNGIDTHNI